MASFPPRFLRYGLAAEAWFDRTWRRLLHRFAPDRPVRIIPFHSYGTPQSLWLKGRVLRQPEVIPASVTDTRWANARRMVSRFLSREVPHVQVALRFGDQEEVTQTDDEGYYDVRIDLTVPPATDILWHDVSVRLLEEQVPGQGTATALGKVMIPTGSRFGIISDIDDTVLVSYVQRKLQLAWVMLIGNAYSRLAFKGVAAFYQALQRGDGTGPYNPIFYVSNSPWNLYDFMNAFMTAKDVPVGPIYLRDFGLNERGVVLRSTATHKLERIRRVLATYPHLPFLLIGDSGEHDPWIYQQVVHEHPGRILAVYIRDVRAGARDQALQNVAQQLAAEGVEMVVARDTVAAATHAATHGFMRAECLPSVLADAKRNT